MARKYITYCTNSFFSVDRTLNAGHEEIQNSQTTETQSRGPNYPGAMV